MKKLLSILAGLIVSGVCIAGPPDGVSPFIEITAIPTNGAAVTSGIVTNEAVYTGWLYGFRFDFTGYATPTVDVDIVTVATTRNGPERTLLSIDSVAADANYYPRDIIDTTAGVDITGEHVMIPLISDKIVVKAYSANVTNVIGLKVFPILTH